MNIDKIFGDIEKISISLLRKHREKLYDLKVSLKEDRTLLTEADTEIQQSIVEIIRDHDLKSKIIGEENIGQNKMQGDCNTIWIIDPIDGTKEFINPKKKEYCTAICLLQAGVPTAALVVSPELGGKGNSLIVKAASETGKVIVNGKPVSRKTKLNKIPKKVSATRSAGTAARDFEYKLTQNKCQIKTRTTSQTIDLLRVAANALDWPIQPFIFFDIFYRDNQKIWDGAPGICLNQIAGNICINENGEKFTSFSNNLLTDPTPVIALTIVGAEDHIKWFKEVMRKR